MTLLTVVQDAAVLCGLTAPSAVYSSADPNTVQMVRLLMVEGRYLLNDHDWQTLQTTRTFTCAATNAQTEPQSDFLRMSRGVDMWNASSQWPITGPLSAEEWNDIIVRSVSTLPQYWRIIAGVLNIYTPSSGDSIRYEYITNKWILQAGVTAGTVLTADTDTFRFPEAVLTLGIVWRWKKAKGLDYAEDMRDWQIQLDQAKGNDKGGRRVFNTDRTVLARRNNTWNGTITPAP